MRCSGESPCTACRSSGILHVYSPRDRKIKVGERCVESLVQENRRLRQALESRGLVEQALTPDPASEDVTGDNHKDKDGDGVYNAAMEERPWFMSLRSDTKR